MIKIKQVFATGKFLPPGSNEITKAVRVMKITAVLLTVLCLHAFAGGHTQGITISLKNASLETVFKEIKEQTGYGFVYRKDQLEGTKKVDVNVNNASIKQVLEICFRDQPITYTIEGNIVVVSEKSNPKTRNFTLPSFPPIDIRGRVVNENNEPIEGASIKVKGTDIGTNSNEKGEFELLNIDEGSVIQISHVSFESQEIKAGKKDDITIKLADKIGSLSTLTFNTGYQTMKANEVTGSIVTIRKSQLDQRIATDIISKLEGITNGIVFNKNAVTGDNQIRIRGESTIFGYSDPLLVVDNFPYPLKNIGELNPNDVESITILKDAAAASIYGARAGNGVIVITTKTGKVNQPLRVQMYVNQTITEKPDLFYLPIMSPSQFIDNEIFRFQMGEYDQILGFDDQKQPVSPIIEILNNRRMGLISSMDSATQINALRKNDWRNEALDHLYRKATSQQYQLNLSGSSNKMSYYFSAGYDKNLSSVVGNQSDRITLNSRTNYTPFRNLELSMSINYGEQKIESRGLTETSISNYFPYMKLADENGSPLAVPQHRAVWEDTITNHGFPDMKYFPLKEREFSSFKGGIYTTRMLTQLRYTILNGLKASASYQYYRSSRKSRYLQTEQSFYIRNNYGRFAIVSPDGRYISTNYPLGGQLEVSNSNETGHSGRLQLDYNKKWYNHAISTIAGFEVMETRSEGNSSRFYGYDDGSGSFVIPDFFAMHPIYVGSTQIGNARIGSQGLSLSPYRLDRFRSFYANATYIFKNKYGFSASTRLDQANIFGVETNRKGTPLWSVGTKWDASKEKFYKGRLRELLPELSLKLTYGYQGNISPSAVAATTIRYDGNTSYTGWPYAIIENFPNPELRWEKIGQINFGLNFVSKNNRVSGTLEYFRKNGKDMLGNAPIDPTTGISSMLGNFSDIESKGLDFMITTRNIDREFKWYTTFIFNYAAEKVTRYDLEAGALSSKNAYFTPTPLVGYPLYSVFSYRWGGLDPTTGNPRIYLGDTLNMSYDFQTQSQLKMSDMAYSGRYNPPIAGSLSNTLSWKSIGFTFNLIYKLGHFFRRSSISYSAFAYNWRLGHADYGLRWQNPGDEKTTYVPSSPYPQQNGVRDQYFTQSDVLVEKADHVRLQFIDLSYSFSESMLRKLKMHNLSLHFYASNLGIIWRANDKKIDPDYPFLDYPPSRSFSVGINATF